MSRKLKFADLPVGCYFKWVTLLGGLGNIRSVEIPMRGMGGNREESALVGNLARRGFNPAYARGNRKGGRKQ